MAERTQLSWPARIAGAAGALVIRALIWLLGRVVRTNEVSWLVGPVGGEHIGDRPYAELAKREGLEVTRDARDTGLLPRFDVLTGPGFDAAQVDPRIRAFYEQTASYELDAETRSHFPLNLGLWLLVKTLSRQVDQMNFPLDALESARGVTSEVVLLRDGQGKTRYTGWSRRGAGSQRTIYTGFYMTTRIPSCAAPVVKAVFPMPHGNATVLLQPVLLDGGRLKLVSSGRRFGEPDFYRVDQLPDGRLRVWRVRSLVEELVLYVDDQGDVRCDHRLRFWGLPALSLHYRMRRARS